MAAIRSLLFSSRSVSCLRMKLGLKTPTFFRQFSNKGLYTMNSTCSVPEFDGRKIFDDHNQLYKFSIDHPDKFWSKLAVSRLDWFKEFDQVSNCDLKQGRIQWFLGGKLNVTVNCVDRHAEKTPHKVALIWEKDEPEMHEFVTYRQLQEMVNQFANMLRANNVRKGDRVALYLPMCPTVVVAMLACARIGAMHSVIFAGFSAEALTGRIQDAQANTVITADQGVRGGRKIELKKIVDEAVAKCPSVQQVFVYKRTGADVPMGPKDIPLDQALKGMPKSVCKPMEMDSEDPLFMLYTSGSTGKPKGVVHTTAGYLLYVSTTHKHVFDYREGEIFGCVADVGWITGHSYVVYGPLCNGATTLLFESTPTYPDPGRYWETVERLKINHLYLAPTAIRLLLKSGDAYVRKYDRSSLRILGSVGEPLNHEAWEWYHRVVGENKCDIVDTWWQTETVGIAIAPRPSNCGDPIHPAMPMRPFYGIDPCLIDRSGNEVEGDDTRGMLCIRKPWPGMCRTIYGDHERFINTYLKSPTGYYNSSDGAVRLEDGNYRIIGRMDDVINVSGHRLGTAEIEDAMGDHPDVAESAVVGYPHDIKGEGIYAFVVLKDHATDSDDIINKELKTLVKSKISSFAQPDSIMVLPGLPRTRSGKIMRRILRKVVCGESDFGDVSTLVDPSIVELILKRQSESAHRSL